MMWIMKTDSDTKKGDALRGEYERGAQWAEVAEVAAADVAFCG